MSKEKKIDMVSHPPHYEGSTSLECIQCMEVSMGKNAVSNFCLCNTFKYLWRYKHKNGKEDVAKARWYLDHVLKYMERNEDLNEDIVVAYHRLNDLWIEVHDYIANGGLDNEEKQNCSFSVSTYADGE